MFCLLAKISSELYKFGAIRPRIPQMMQNLHHFLIHYTLCFQMPDHRPDHPVNQVKFTPFTHKSHELRKFYTRIHPHLVHYFQTSDH